MHYIIGDLHSNVKELKRLLAIIKPKKNDTLIFLGDYIDKNIETKEAVDLLMKLAKKHHCIFIKGEHEYVWDKYLNHNELFRQDFLLKYGSAKALEKFTNKAEALIKKNSIAIIKTYLQKYLDLIAIMADYYIIGDYIALHAGIKKDQMTQKPLVFEEINYFLRKDGIDMSKKYLDKYTVVAAHTCFGNEPLIKKGYINIDLGAGYGKFLGALDTKNKKVIRSDGVIFNI